MVSAKAMWADSVDGNAGRSDAPKENRTWGNTCDLTAFDMDEPTL